MRLRIQKFICIICKICSLLRINVISGFSLPPRIARIFLSIYRQPICIIYAQGAFIISVAVVKYMTDFSIMQETTQTPHLQAFIQTTQITPLIYFLSSFVLPQKKQKVKSRTIDPTHSLPKNLIFKHHVINADI